MVCAGHPFRPLLNITLHQLQVFEAGEEVYRYSLAIGNQLSEMHMLLADMKGKLHGALSMVVSQYGEHFRAHPPGEFNKRHKGITVDIEVTNRENLLKSLAANTTDFAIMGKPPEGWNWNRNACPRYHPCHNPLGR